MSTYGPNYMAAFSHKVALFFRRTAEQILSNYTRRTLFEWVILMTFAAGSVVIFVKLAWWDRADKAIYDISVAAQHKAVPDDIVIVQIDDQSLSAVGRWPWRRRILASLINRIASGGAKVIGVDIILSEPDTVYPGDDLALFQSVAMAGNVVLPALVEVLHGEPQLRQPLSGFNSRAGHINIAVDVDGVVRQVDLVNRVQGVQLNHFAVEMLAVEASRPPATIGAGGRPNNSISATMSANSVHHFRIPFIGPPGSFRQISASEVLSGNVPPDAFRGKYVLLGAAASGLGDVFPTPLSQDGRGMSGVEIIANIMQALRAGDGIVDVQPIWFWLCTMIPLFIAGVALLFLTPRSALLATIGIVGAALAFSIMSLAYLHIWFAPASTLFVTSLIYPLWSWRRQEAVLRFLEQSVKKLENEPGLSANAEIGITKRNLDSRIQSVNTMTMRLRDMRQFLADGLESLPDATVICDPAGNVLLANRPTLFLAPQTMSEQESMHIPTMRELVAEIFVHERPGLDKWERLRATISAGDAADNVQWPQDVSSAELETRNGRQILMRGASLRSGAGGVAGHIVSFIDITDVRLAEQRREEYLRFLSHDMRSPQASILALIELQNEPERAIRVDKLLGRISEHANRTLELADDFIRLARAEAPHWKLRNIDVASVVLDATDELWELANTANIDFDININEDDFTVLAEPVLLTRAVANLLSNAIKFSPPHSTINVRLYRENAKVAISISDTGPGIAREDHGMLFQPFSRLRESDSKSPSGSGLGLVFVKTVVDRHGGHIALQSHLGAGATFTIFLPSVPRVIDRFH